MSSSATPWTAECQASLSLTISWSLLKLMSVEKQNKKPHAHWFGEAIESSHYLLPPSPPALSLSQHQGLSNELALHVTLELELQHQSFQWIFRLISFRIYWFGFDLLAVQWILKKLLQHHSLKASTLQPSAFSIVQLSHPYMATGKNKQTKQNKKTQLWLCISL